jgi:hypothetical protein
MEFFARSLVEREYRELTMKGYLKLKMEIPKEKLSDFDIAYRSGKEITFRYQGEEIKTIITNVDVAEESHDDLCKVFLGFARQ